MPTTPYAKVQLSVNGGAIQTTAQTVAGSSTIALSAESISDWAQARWEIYQFPEGWPTPAGWTYDAAKGVFFSTSFTPSSFVLEAAATRWGKWLVRLLVNAESKAGVSPHPDLKSDVMGWEVLSPVLGLRETGYLEAGQFDPIRQWVTSIQKNFKTLNTALGALAGDVTGPVSATIVERLTGVAGVVNLPIGNKLTSTGGSHVGDIITTAAGVLTFGNVSNATTTQLRGTVAVYINSIANGGNVQLSASGVGGEIYADSAIVNFRDASGTTSQTVKFYGVVQLDASTGTFPSSGFLRSKYYSGVQNLWTGRLASADAPIISQNTNALTFGDGSWGTVILDGGTAQIGTSTRGLSVLSVVGRVDLRMPNTEELWIGSTSVTSVKFDATTVAGNPVKIRFSQDVVGTLGYEPRTGDNATRLLSIVGQAASTAATGTNEDGGHIALVGGTPDGAGVYGLVQYSAGEDRGYGDYPWPSDANQTLTAAQSTLNIVRLSAGTISAGRNLTVTRRAAAPGQILIRNVTGFTITVFWLTGTGIAVANNTSALIGSDGTNAILLQ